MMIALHKNARTTPATRAQMAASSETAATLALRYGTCTVYKCKGRDSFRNAPYTPQRLQTTLTLAQEKIVVELRNKRYLPLNDLLAATREFLCSQATLSGLDRCLHRHGVGNLNALKPKEPAQLHKAFKSYEPGFSSSISNTRHKRQTRLAGANCLWPQPALRDSCLFRSRATSSPLPLARF